MDYPYHDFIRTDVLRLVPKDGQTIVSVGCGRAATEAVLRERGRTIYGVDISPQAIAVAQTRLDRALLIRPGDPLPFEPRSVDGLILADVIEHMPHAWDRLREMASIVRKGGWVVISVPNMRSLKVVFTFIIRGDWPEEETGVFDATHVEMMSKPRLERWCRAAGLTVDVWEVVYLSESTAKGKLLRVFDRATFGLLRTWVSLQWQCRCRVL